MQLLYASAVHYARNICYDNIIYYTTMCHKLVWYDGMGWDVVWYSGKLSWYRPNPFWENNNVPNLQLYDLLNNGYVN